MVVRRIRYSIVWNISGKTSVFPAAGEIHRVISVLSRSRRQKFISPTVAAPHKPICAEVGDRTLADQGARLAWLEPRTKCTTPHFGYLGE